MIELSTPFDAAARAGRRIGHRVEAHASLGSTNDRARALLDSDDVEGVAVLAEEQRTGRGRRGRTWSSPSGRNLTFSVAVRPRLAAADGWQLGLGAALACREGCLPIAHVGLKWPNDLVAADERKLAGLLVETAIEDGRLTAAVIGIGLNVNWRHAEMPAELAASATSLAELVGHDVDRVAVLSRLLDALDAEVAAIEAGRSPLDRYRRACVTLGRSVAVESGGGTVAGRAVDLDATGSLVVETGGGRIVLASGEVVHVRPLEAA
jgi:BirA family transcriptional regulator, biotin operon repressor / biotin---[acetyl-CoA-carboxylase] ligase